MDDNICCAKSISDAFTSSDRCSLGYDAPLRKGPHSADKFLRFLLSHYCTLTIAPQLPCTMCCTSINITTKATTNVGAHPRLVRFPDPHVSRGTRLTHVPRCPFSFSLFFHRKCENIFSKEALCKRTQAFVLCTEEHLAQLPIAEIAAWLAAVY